MRTALVAWALCLVLSPETREPDEAARLLALANAARAEARLPPLRREPTLDEVARANTRHMARNLRPRHTDEGVLQRLGPAAAENVGAAASADELHRLLLASRPHRTNLLGPYDAVGIAAERGRDGRLYATLVFARTNDHRSK